MARIRSVHPTLFTDEAWVSCSPLARVLYIGLMTDADDQGLFEWKPLQIRMRLLAGDNADVPSLLAELIDANLIAQLESAGKKLGAIRYFRRFQRPKKPTATFTLPSEWRTYVGLSDDGSELGDDEAMPGGEPEPPKPPPVPPKSEISPQMEDGGWRMEEEEGADAPSSASPACDLDADFEMFWTVYPLKKGKDAARKAFPKAMKRISIEAMMLALEDQREWDQWRRGFIPHAATWLNGARWADEQPAHTDLRPIHEPTGPYPDRLAAREANNARALAGAAAAAGQRWKP